MQEREGISVFPRAPERVRHQSSRGQRRGDEPPRAGDGRQRHRDGKAGRARCRGGSAGGGGGCECSAARREHSRGEREGEQRLRIRVGKKVRPWRGEKQHRRANAVRPPAQRAQLDEQHRGEQRAEVRDGERRPVYVARHLHSRADDERIERQEAQPIERPWTIGRRIPAQREVGIEVRVPALQRLEESRRRLRPETSRRVLPDQALLGRHGRGARVGEADGQRPRDQERGTHQERRCAARSETASERQQHPISPGAVPRRDRRRRSSRK